MTKITKITFLLLFTVLAFVGCDKEEEPVVNNDNSLIIVQTHGTNYGIVSPKTGALIIEAEPNIASLKAVALGYHSTKALVLSKAEADNFVKSIFSCDRETGDNLFQVTSKQDWDVMFFDGSPVGPQIVFSAQNVDELSDDNIHKINEDGSGYMRLSSRNKVVDCFGVSCKIWSAYDPVWSPDASKIAFDIHLREVVLLHPHNSICLMNADGSNKQMLYDENMEEAQYKDICFTQDGQFIVFLQGLANSTKAKVLHINSKTLIDITNQLTVGGLHPTSLWTSPNENKIIFNKYEPGGGDLYVIDFKVNGDQFQIDGNYRMLASYQDNSLHLGAPDWQLWNGN